MKVSKISILLFLITAGLISLNFSMEEAAFHKSYTLRYSLDTGAKFTLTSVSDQSFTQNQMGNESTSDSHSESTLIFTVTEKNNEGLSIELEFGDASSDMTTEMGSNDGDFSALLGEKVTFNLSSNGKVTETEGFEELPEVITGSGEPLTGELQKLTIESLFGELPEDPIEIGGTWNEIRTFDVPIGDGSVILKNNTVYTLVEEVIKDGYDCLKIEAATVSTITGEFSQGGNDLGIERESNINGHFYFAYKVGIMIEGSSETEAEGVISVFAAGMEIDQTVSGTSSFKVTIEK